MADGLRYAPGAQLSEFFAESLIFLSSKVAWMEFEY